MPHVSSAQEPLYISSHESGWEIFPSQTRLERHIKSPNQTPAANPPSVFSPQSSVLSFKCFASPRFGAPPRRSANRLIKNALLRTGQLGQNK